MADVKTQRGPPDPELGAVEPRDIDVAKARLMLFGIAGLVALVAGSVAATLSLFGAVHDPVVHHPAARPRPSVAVPLQTDERGDRARIEARAAARLAGRNGRGTISQAMRRTAAAGWDAP